ncbi:MAG: hypothetical protein ACFCUI_02660 [Bernardetiaceae bacterium]
MKIFVKYLLWAFLLTYTSLALAQPNPKMRAEKQSQRLAKELNMSAEQAKTVQAALETRMTKAAAATTKEEKKAAQQEFKATLKGTLSDEQWQKHQQLMEERKAQREQNKAEREAFKESLALTPEQEEQLDEAQAQRREQMQALKAEADKNQAQRKAIREDYEANLREILTPEQWEKWKANQADKKEKVKKENPGRGKGREKKDK